MAAMHEAVIEMDNHQAVVSVKLLDQHRVVGKVEPVSNKETYRGAKIRGPDELTLSV